MADFSWEEVKKNLESVKEKEARRSMLPKDIKGGKNKANA